MGHSFIEVSALQSNNVEQAFSVLVREMRIARAAAVDEAAGGDGRACVVC